MVGAIHSAVFSLRTRSGRRPGGLFASLLVWLGAGAGLLAQDGSNWRVYKAADGLGESLTKWVTVSPRGNVWASHSGQSDSVSKLDGYTIKPVRMIDDGGTPVYESRSGQLWSVNQEGLMLYSRGVWTAHPVAEIRAEMSADLLRRVRSVPLIPAEVDHVFFLLPARLLDYEAVSGRVTVILAAGQTGLGRFNEMVEARDGGIWVTGQKGLLKFPGPLRQLRAGAPVEEFLIPEGLKVANPQRPFEDDAGGVTMVVETPGSTQKAIAHFDGRNWSIEPTPNDKIRFAWRSAQGGFWALTRDQVLHFDAGRRSVIERPEFAAAHFFDVVTQPNGVFWLATSDGLARHSLLPWRAPAQAPDAHAATYAALEDRAGRLWFAEANGLLALHSGKWSRLVWPAEGDTYLLPGDGLLELPNGAILVGSHERPLLLDPGAGSLRPLPLPPGARSAQLAGRFKDGSACFLLASPEDGGPAWRLEKFDGVKWSAFLEARPGQKPGSEFTFVQELDNGDVWLGGNGVLEWHREGKVQAFGPKEGFTGGRVTCLAEVASGKIWCGAGDSVWEFDGKSWMVLRSGLDRVYALERARDGSVWVAAGTGLHRHQDGVWVSTGSEEGLPSSVTYQAREDRRGNLWAATARGLALRYPTADPDPPRTTLVRAPAPPDSPGNEVVTIGFRGQDKWKQTPAERLLYSYRLDGAAWSLSTLENSISFTDLPAGKHRLEVRALDRNWNLERAPAFLEFEVTLPWQRDPRLIVISIAGLAVALFFAGVAVNRHFRLVRGYAEIERIVEQRTEELKHAHAELLHSQKMKALGTLAAGVAHDFNNILSIVKGSAQIIETNLGNAEKVRTRVNRIKTVVEQGSAIVKTILGLSQAAARTRSAYDVNEMLADMAKLPGDRLLGEVALVVEPNPELPLVNGSRDLVQQILLNLLVNASEATSGVGRIILRARLAAQPPADAVLPPAVANPYVLVSVQDFGPGIAPDVLPRIFEPFFTTKALSTRRGTGLGLSMVYELAKEMGCGIKVEAVLNYGSTFTIILPVEPPERPASPTAGLTETTGGSGGPGVADGRENEVGAAAHT